MAAPIEAGADALVMDAADHVATAIRDITAGETIQYVIQGRTESLTAADAIPLGHKIAIADIPEGEKVCKYGEVIGRATEAIGRGRHLHVHNIEGIRGRGDIAKGASAS
ncbi:UxaA family hydrolase [Paenibacillus hodogayensis]|uniref:UxaA family hydrolase n=1 Tax=Paenibacillus hodogayensis TaxID=279208 RepID=A0ABV5W6E1_9BACL